MDRQDIDALLIGALYGELSPADEARLAAHLESHPTDRGALDDLKIARQAVLDSRIFAVQLEPPQAVSALLLQEAHRRAPKRVVRDDGEQKESWFYRFTRVFMAHPAMAAAAMLVLVLGGAGIVYMKKGDQQFANREVASPTMTADQAAPTSAAMPEGAAAGSAALATGSAYGADLYEAEKADDPAPADTASERWHGQQEQVDQRRRAEREEPRKKTAAPSRAIAVTTEKGALKDFDKPKAAPKKGAAAPSLDFDGADDTGAIGGAGGRGGGGAGAASTLELSQPQAAPADRAYAQPPPPPPAQPGTVATNKPTTTKSATAAPRAPEPKAPAATVAKPTPTPDAPAKQEAKRDDSSLVAWAKGEHQRAVALAQKGDCSSAAKVALSVSTRASEYYAQFMATDRALKQCAAYINAERDRDAERSGKARAQKRVNADEAPAATK